ncbi:MAG: hypothetical protein HC819_01645 [Cyclobacteriaceae bacterium]|nr:hypothetical protein [Cyclobacteriaceae bacterium]
MKAWWESISRRQNMEVGVLFALVVLLIGGTDEAWRWVAIGALAVVLVWPVLFKPITFVWFAFARMLSMVFSKVMLSIIYFLFIVPVGLVRKWVGKDNLKLKGFKLDRRSVFQSREHRFEPEDFTHTF